MNTRPWHVLHVQSNHEKHVAKHLAVRSVEHYLPLYSERVQWTDRTVITERPLFNGYVFVRLVPEQRISVLSIPGVYRLLGEDGRDMVSDVELGRIREGLRTGMRLRPFSGVSLGSRVRILCGVFGNATGVVTQLHQNCRVIITLEAIRQSFSLEIDMRDIEVLNESNSKADFSGLIAESYS